LSELTTTKELNSKLETTIRSLNDVNANLEEHVVALTHANGKLSNYAWAHAHELRAPVARMVGLANLIRLKDDSNKEFIMQALDQTAGELDVIMRQMNSLLQDVRVKGKKTA
jgi:light-regulated signal transduction histidine kinase (bacteriophytochrome)